MPKCIKIAPTTICEIEDYETDLDYINMEHHDGYSLMVPERWGHNKYKLSMFVGVGQLEHNVLATSLFNNLFIPHCQLADIVRGTAYVLNENDDGSVDFKRDDLKYIIEHMEIWTSKWNR